MIATKIVDFVISQIFGQSSFYESVYISKTNSEKQTSLALYAISKICTYFESFNVWMIFWQASLLHKIPFECKGRALTVSSIFEKPII